MAVGIFLSAISVYGWIICFCNAGETLKTETSRIFFLHSGSGIVVSQSDCRIR